jgi:hypothetical protein
MVIKDNSHTSFGTSKSKNNAREAPLTLRLNGWPHLESMVCWLLGMYRDVRKAPNTNGQPWSMLFHPNSCSSNRSQCLAWSLERSVVVRATWCWSTAEEETRSSNPVTPFVLSDVPSEEPTWDVDRSFELDSYNPIYGCRLWSPIWDSRNVRTRGTLQQPDINHL